MTQAIRDLMTANFDALARKDKAAVLKLFAPEGVVIDPHYPKPRMTGRMEIGAGLDWAFGGIERFSFEALNWFDGVGTSSAAVETRSRHVLKGGRGLDFQQVFVVEARDGLLVRVQGYEPYGPNGVAGAILGFQRLKARLRH